jgi:hypothetical protein
MQEVSEINKNIRKESDPRDGGIKVTSGRKESDPRDGGVKVTSGRKDAR